MSKFECPICGSDKCELISVNGNDGLIRCKEGYTFRISAYVLSKVTEDREKIFNLIFEHLLREPYCGENVYWSFYFDDSQLGSDESHPEQINLANLIKSYPSSFIEMVNRTLINLSYLYPRFGDIIGASYIDFRTAYCIGDDIEYQTANFFELMFDIDYLARKDEHKDLFYISANGWKKVEELRKKQQEINQGFIAMSFCEETKPIRQAFRIAINDSGYSARFIDEKEHNNQIVPEIFYEIQRSKFVVVDVTYPNYGAYYEAGYAQGLGKEVIVCCKKDALANESGKYIRPHFDISQKSMVIWNDLEELVARLKRRIEATVR